MKEKTTQEGKMKEKTTPRESLRCHGAPFTRNFGKFPKHRNFAVLVPDLASVFVGSAAKLGNFSENRKFSATRGKNYRKSKSRPDPVRAEFSKFENVGVGKNLSH